MMKRTWRLGLFILPVAIAGTYISADAQTGGRTVAGTGGVACSDQRMRIVGTLGQPIVGVAATSYGYIEEGFWHTPSSKSADSPDRPGEVPAAIRCTPNPIVNSATVEITLSQSDNVMLTLHDLLGRPVRTLANDRKTAGTYSVELNTDNIASGRYTLRMTVGTEVRTIPLIIAH